MTDITRKVNDSSPRTICSVALVNKYFQSSVQAIRNRQRTLLLTPHFYDEGLDQPQYAWTHDVMVLTNLRHLTINEGRKMRITDLQPYDTWVQSLSPVCDLVSRINNLKSLTWNIGPLPKAVLDILTKQHPNAELRIFNYRRKDPDISHLTADETALLEFNRLTNLRAVTRHNNIYIDTDGIDYCLNVFKHIIARSQSLQYASINDSSCHARPFGLTTSKADGVTVSTGRQRCESLKTLTLDSTRFKLSQSILEDWDCFLNIANLETLKFVRGLPQLDFFQNAATMLPGIKHVSLNFQEIVNQELDSDRNALLAAANQYLLTCPPLLSISIWNALPHVDVWQMVNHHSTTIQALQVHQRESEYGAMRDILSLDLVAHLRRTCSKLRDLTIDINRCSGAAKEDNEQEGVSDRANTELAVPEFILEQDTHTLATLDELALFGSQLSRLRLYVDSRGLAIHFRNFDGYRAFVNAADGCELPHDADDNAFEVLQEALIANPSAPVHPELLTKKYASDIWHRVYGDQLFGERALDVKFGEWESKEKHRFDVRRFFKIRPHERDDRIGDCSVRMKSQTY